MKKNLALIFLLTLSPLSFADDNWVKFSDGFYQVKGKSLDGSKSWATAQLVHIAGVKGVSVVFNFKTPNEVQKCQADSSLSNLGIKQVAINGVLIDTGIGCRRMQIGNINNVTVVYVPTSPETAKIIYNEFSESRTVTINNFKFSALGFNKSVEEYKKYYGI